MIRALYGVGSANLFYLPISGRMRLESGKSRSNAK